MNLSKNVFSFFVLPIFLLVSISSASAQSNIAEQLEPSYEVALNMVIGSNEPVAGANLPAGLSAVSKHLKGSFSFSNYRLANTFIGRVSNTGSIEYKSVSNILGQASPAEAQTFLEWSLGNFRAVPNGFQARSFRFGARVPVKVQTSKDSAGVVNSVVNYEAIGLSMNMIGLPANTPTLIGTISLPNTAGTIFLVATVRLAEM
ncbi:MAG: hypothetical protein ABI481_03440 [Pyrinomonadaceae bacterium]